MWIPWPPGSMCSVHLPAHSFAHPCARVCLERIGIWVAANPPFQGRAVLILCCWILPLRPRTGHLRLLYSPTASELTKATAGGHSGYQTDTAKTCGPGAAVGEPPGWHQKAQATCAKMESLSGFFLKGAPSESSWLPPVYVQGRWGHRQSSQSPVCTCLSWTSC